MGAPIFVVFRCAGIILSGTGVSRMSTTLRLAKFAAETASGDIPDEVMHHGKRCVINMLGVALHATHDTALRIVLDVFGEEGGRKLASVIGTSVQTTLQN